LLISTALTARLDAIDWESDGAGAAGFREGSESERVLAPLRHLPDQTAGEGSLQRLAGEVLLLLEVHDHSPLAAGVVDVPSETIGLPTGDFACIRRRPRYRTEVSSIPHDD